VPDTASTGQKDVGHSPTYKPEVLSGSPKQAAWRLQENPMVKPNEIAAIASDLWYLPDEQVARVKEIVRDLRREHGLSAPDYDDSDLTDEDKRDIARAAIIRFDREHPEDEGYDDIPTR